jgi:hypothetical protein
MTPAMHGKTFTPKIQRCLAWQVTTDVPDLVEDRGIAHDVKSPGIPRAHLCLVVISLRVIEARCFVRGAR